MISVMGYGFQGQGQLADNATQRFVWRQVSLALGCKHLCPSAGAPSVTVLELTSQTLFSHRLYLYLTVYRKVNQSIQIGSSNDTLSYCVGCLLFKVSSCWGLPAKRGYW
jgi:hypothetical protein